MVLRSTYARPILPAIAIAVLACDSKKLDTAQTTSEPQSQQTDAAAAAALPSGSSAPPAPPGWIKGDDPPEWLACSKPQDCTLVNFGQCCAICNPFHFEGHYTSINRKFKDDYAARHGCNEVKCPQCPPEQPDYPRTSANFFSLCQEGRCQAVDLRFSKYEACTTAKDCVFRFGLGCCEGCGDHDLVTYNPASGLDRDVCPQKPKCPHVSAECRGYRRPQQPPECVVERCQLSD
jgi:hypothetical protein